MILVYFLYSFSWGLLMLKCKNCGVEYEGFACPSCGLTSPSVPPIGNAYPSAPNNLSGQGSRFCQRCGTPFSGAVCGRCGAPAVPVQSPLVWAILSTICCCLPFGIVSIVYAAKVNSLVASGAYVDAEEAARQAVKWAWIAFGCGIVTQIIGVIIQILAAAAQNGEF